MVVITITLRLQAYGLRRHEDIHVLLIFFKLSKCLSQNEYFIKKDDRDIEKANE